MTKNLLRLLFLTACSVYFTGCFNATPDEQSVPWGRPAEWERTAPALALEVTSNQCEPIFNYIMHLHYYA